MFLSRSLSYGGNVTVCSHCFFFFINSASPKRNVFFSCFLYICPLFLLYFLPPFHTPPPPFLHPSSHPFLGVGSFVLGCQGETLSLHLHLFIHPFIIHHFHPSTLLLLDQTLSCGVPQCLPALFLIYSVKMSIKIFSFPHSPLKNSP